MCGTPYAEFQGLPAEAMTAVGYPQGGAFPQDSAFPPAAAFPQASGYEQTTALPQFAVDPLQGQLPTHRPTHAQPVDAGFDSLFRRPEGELNPHSRTQLIPPVETDYRLPPPDGQNVAAF